MDQKNYIQILWVKYAFGIPDLLKHPYSLHCICINQISCENSQYYSYIFNRFDKKWRKYSDIRVSEVNINEIE